MKETMNTYTVQIDGLFYALGAGLFMDRVYSLETSRSAPVPPGTGCRGRNAAIRSVCTGYPTGKIPLALARRSGNYVGQLWTGDPSMTKEV